MLKHKFVKLGAVVVAMGFIGVANAQNNAKLNQIYENPNSPHARTRANVMKWEYTSPFGHFGIMNAYKAPISRDIAENWEQYRPYYEKAGAPFVDKPVMVMFDEMDSKEKCEQALQWAGDINNMNKIQALYVNDHPNADPMGYGGSSDQYVRLNCRY